MNYRLFVVILVLSFALFVLDSGAGLSSIKGVARSAFAPIGKIGTTFSAKLRRPFSDFGEFRSLLRNTGNLETENLRLKSEISRLEEAARENEALRREIGLLPRGVSRRTIAFVIGRVGAGPYGTLLIDRGGEAGIKEGDLVLSNGIVVGRISQVSGNTAEITPITNVNAVLPGLLQESRGIGIIRGSLKGVVLSDIPLDAPVKEGETVVTASIGNVIPSGFFVGTVEEVKRRPGDLFLETTIKYTVRLSDVDTVTVVGN
jgi:rod shape-determining protein MreC